MIDDDNDQKKQKWLLKLAFKNNDEYMLHIKNLAPKTKQSKCLEDE